MSWKATAPAFIGACLWGVFGMYGAVRLEVRLDRPAQIYILGRTREPKTQNRSPDIVRRHHGEPVQSGTDVAGNCRRLHS